MVWHLSVQFSKHYLLNTLSLPHCCFPARTLHDHVDVAVCLGPLFTFTDQLTVIMSVPFCVDYCSFVMCFEARKFGLCLFVLQSGHHFG